VVGAAVIALAAVSCVGFSDSGGGQTSSLKAIARGRAWFEKLATGRARSLQELAKHEGIIRHLVNLAFLSPAILRGRQPVELTATRLTELDLPLDWTE
jgi:site-specific DNA recombinase